MHAESDDASTWEGLIEILLDGQPVGLPPHRRSLAGIRSYLESRALEQQRILCSFTVEESTASNAGLWPANGQFLRVVGQTMGLDQMPLQLVENAIRQATRVQAEVQSAVLQVMINEATRGHELWWNLSQGLKQPLLTLSLLPEPVGRPANGSASAMQLRRWQLEQLAGIIKEVDRACQGDDPTALSDALENRVLPWLAGLQETLALLRMTLLAGQEITYCKA